MKQIIFKGEETILFKKNIKNYDYLNNHNLDVLYGLQNGLIVSYTGNYKRIYKNNTDTDWYRCYEYNPLKNKWIRI